MTNQLITYRLPIDYSLISLMSLMSSISYVWGPMTIPKPETTETENLGGRAKQTARGS